MYVEREIIMCIGYRERIINYTMCVSEGVSEI